MAAQQLNEKRNKILRVRVRVYSVGNLHHYSLDSILEVIAERPESS
jgi:hypothetical protein